MMIDPQSYGSLTRQVADMEKKIDKLEASVEQLLALANKSHGGLWVGIAIISAVSGLIGFLASLVNASR